MKKLLSVLLAFAMMLAMFSGMVIFTASADGEEVQMHIPFINQYTLEQAQKMGTKNTWVQSTDNYSNASNYSLAKDDQGRTVISFTTPEGVSPDWKVCTGYLSTGTSATPFVKDGLIDGINIFGDAELSNKTKLAFKLDGDANFKSAFSNINLMFNSGTERVCLSLQSPTKSNGYLIYDFSKITRNGYDESGIALPKDAGNFHDAFDGRISTLNMAIIFNKTNLPVTFWFEDVYLVGAADTVDLHRAIREGKAAGLTGSVITNAEAVYLNDASTQEQIDAAAAAIDAALDEIKYGYQKAKQDLDALLTTASDLGFFDSGYEHYQVVSDADMAYSDPASTLDVLRYYIGVVRMLVAGELVENNDLYDALARCSNVWRYNYTDKSYKALLAAIDEAWAIIESDAAGAIAILDAAYDALEALPTKSTTADFFDGWTTAQVNDVVFANPTKMDDYILGGNCDFSDDTAFEADGNFSMTAGKTFTTGAMGWKNMDRSGTLANKANGGYPTMNVAGLSQADGIRFKLAVDGSVDNIVVGISNCADMTREQYAKLIKAEFVDEEGYINIPFSYFVPPTGWGSVFAQEELDQVIIFLIEAYGATENTTVTVSDLRGYRQLENATAADAEKLAGIVAKLEAFDIDGKYADLIAAAGELNIDEDYSSDYDEMYDAIFAVLKDYADPDAAIVDVPGFSIFTQEEMSQFPAYDKGGCNFIKTARGMKYSLSNGSWAFVPARFTYVDDGSSYGQYDCLFGKVESFGGKDLIAMLGGYTLNDIIAYRFKVENPVTNKLNQMGIGYKDGVGLWSGMLTKLHYPQYVDGYFTYYMDEITEGGSGDWYGNWTRQQIKDKAKYGVFEIYANVNRDIYGWQVLLFESIDRSELKAALTQYKGLGLASYDDAMATYYDKTADADAIAAAVAALTADATPDAPAAPTAAEITYNSVTLTLGPDNIEYRMGENGEWSGETVYTGLTPNTEYKFYARVAAIGGYNASEPSKPLTVKTLKAPVEGEVAIEGEAVYGATLTASVTGIGDEPGELTYVWNRGDVEVGSGSEYAIVKEDIGATLTVSVTAANYEGTLTSEPTAVIGKATPVVAVAPTASAIMIGEKLGTSQLSGGEADVEGTWAWVDSEIIPELEQSGTTFPVIFTPADTDCYNTVTVDVVVTVTNNVEEISVTDDASGITLTGEFAVGAAPTITVEEIKAGKPSYLALLRAARNSQGNTLILFKNVSVDSRYVGTLTLGAQLSADRAGETYTVWFFADGEVMSAQGVVDANGVIAVSGFIADVLA